MPENPSCEFPPGYDGAALLGRLERVLDPELDESILALGFVRSLRLRAGDLKVVLRLPTSWCAVNFAYLMAEDVRHALQAAPLVRRVRISLGDHCAAAQIEAAVNAGRSFAEAFSIEGAGSLETLRRTFLRKGFLLRQERLLHGLRRSGVSAATICALRLADVAVAGDTIVVRRPGSAAVEAGSAGVLLQRYLERRAELALDCDPAAPLIVALDGTKLSVERLEAHYAAARTMRVAMEANGAFCRALSNLQRSEDALPSPQFVGGADVPP